MADKKDKAERKRTSVAISAAARCKAVLSVWSERRKPSEVCRELEVNWAVLRQWETRALEAMLQALQPRQRQETRPELSRHLVKLMAKKEAVVEAASSRLERRLEKLQESRCGKKAKEPSKAK